MKSPCLSAILLCSCLPTIPWDASALDTNNPSLSGVVAWWPLQGNGQDVSGRNHPLRLAGHAIFGDGVVGEAMVFDGGNDRGRVAAHPDLDLGANDALTLELWINPARASRPQPLLEWTDNVSVVGLHFWISVASPWAGGGPRSLFANVIDRQGVAHHVSSAPGVIASNAFTHVAFTYSKISGLARLYANGQVVAATNLGRVTPETRPGLYAGWRPLGGGRDRFAGKLDEITLYARELSEAELLAIFQAGAAGKASLTNPPPPVAAGDFDVARDFSISGNPNGVWSYGWQSNTAGPFTPVTQTRSMTVGAGVTEQIREFDAATPPYFLHFPLSNTATGTSDGGYGQYPPGTLIAQAGGGAPQNLATIRFTAPSNGNYQVNVAVRSYLDGGPAGDTDFHVARNGAELFGQFLASVGSAAFTNTLSLAAGDTVDFATGRGADDNYYGSGLKISAVITPTTNTPTVTNPPSVVFGDFDAGRDFSAGTNPGGVWGYGWKETLSGSFSNLSVRETAVTGNGVTIPAWLFASGLGPVVYCNTGTVTGVFEGGAAQVPPGTVWYYPGPAGQPQNYAVIRFTAPSNGNYQVAAAVQAVYDGPPQGDTDFHVVRNGAELSGQFLMPTQSFSFTRVIALGSNDVVDFLIGRGADNNDSGSGLKLSAVITPTTNAPAAECVLAPAGLAAWWPFDGGANDLLGGVALALSGEVSYTEGKVLRAMQFNGTNTEALAPSSTALNVGTGEGFSIETWVSPASVTLQPIVEWTPGPGDVGVHFWLGVYGSGALFANLVDTNGVSHSWRSDTDLVVTNVMQHVGMSYHKASGLLRFYLNGVKVTEQPLGTFEPQTGFALAVGHRPGQQHFAGTLDELSLYRRALADGEFAAIHAAGVAGKCSASPPPLTVLPAQP